MGCNPHLIPCRFPPYPHVRLTGGRRWFSFCFSSPWMSATITLCNIFFPPQECFFVEIAMCFFNHAESTSEVFTLLVPKYQFVFNIWVLQCLKEAPVSDRGSRTCSCFLFCCICLACQLWECGGGGSHFIVVTWLNRHHFWNYQTGLSCAQNNRVDAGYLRNLLQYGFPFDRWFYISRTTQHGDFFKFSDRFTPRLILNQFRDFLRHLHLFWSFFPSIRSIGYAHPTTHPPTHPHMYTHSLSLSVFLPLPPSLPHLLYIFICSQVICPPFLNKLQCFFFIGRKRPCVLHILNCVSYYGTTWLTPDFWIYLFALLDQDTWSCIFWPTIFAIYLNFSVKIWVSRGLIFFSETDQFQCWGENASPRSKGEG